MARDRVEQQLPADVLAWISPEAEGDAPAAAQHAVRLASASAGRGTWWMPKFDTTASNASSGYGSASASPSSNRIVPIAPLATASMAGEKSSPVAIAPRMLAFDATRPGPQAMSSSRVPRPIWAASSRASMNGRVAPANVDP